MIAFHDAYLSGAAAPFLWSLMLQALNEPDTTISHTAMPTWDEHVAWLMDRTQRVLLLISAKEGAWEGLVGFVSVTHNNEIGIRIDNGNRGRGYGRQAVQHILDTYKPLPAIPSVRAGAFIANINPANAASIALFTKLGAKHIQNTYRF